MQSAKRTQRENVYQHLREQLTAGALPPGVRLSPAALARELGVSHIPVREALSQLRTEGLIDHVARKGAFVKTIERKDLADLIEVRSVLECHAAAQAARRISVTQLSELDARWQELCRLAKTFDVAPGSNLREQLGQWLPADLAFHMAIFRAAGNSRAIRILEDTRALTHMFGHRTDHPAAWADPVRFAAENLRVHEGIYDAIRRYDPRGARRAMQLHMRRARKNMLARFDWLERQNNATEHTEDLGESVRELVHRIQRGARAGGMIQPPLLDPEQERPT